ncbi:MAG: class I SAM-dependent methyltransferase [Nanoarchaeota archaeon]
MKGLYECPEYYSLIFGKRDFKLECKFIAKAIKKYSRAKTVLDLACGTGPHMTELANMDFVVSGLDLSKGMLAKVETHPNIKNLYCEDMSDFKVPDKFDVCICMINSLEILNTNLQLVSHFNSVSGCLNNGGLYIIELDHPSLAFSNPLPGEKPKVYRKQITRRGVKIDITFKRERFDFGTNLEYNRLIADINDHGKRVRMIDSSPVRRLTVSDIDNFVRVSGNFEIVALLGNFDFKTSLNSKNAKRMIIILRRTK